MNFELARFNMVEQQVRTWEVLDSTVLELMEAQPRHEFVPQAYAQLAYADTAIPIGQGQEMLPPRIEARLVQALDLNSFDRVLEVGTGTGFLTSLLCALGGEVTSVEISSELSAVAQRNLAKHDVHANLLTADALHGWPDGAPYDAIAVSASMPTLDDAFERQLAIGGRLFIVVGQAPAMEAMLIRRTGENEWSRESLFETVLTPLVGVAPPSQFVL